MTLHIIGGCMRAGKTTKLIQDYIKFKQEGNNICIINFLGDIERTGSEYLKSHDNIMVECLNISSFDDEKFIKIIQENKHDIYMLNEGQFFSKLRDASIIITEKLKRDLYVYALDGDSNRENFGDIHKILPLCDTYEKLYAKCDCGKKALFSKRLVPFENQTLIGTDMYKSVCRECF